MAIIKATDQETYKIDEGKDVEIVGIKDAILNYTISYRDASGDVVNNNHSYLTQTTQFYTPNDWYTLRADACRIELKDTAGTAVAFISLKDCFIRAKLVYRFSGKKGYIHDSFSNHEDILKNGERLFKLENNMICNVTQVNQLADYWWKFHKNKKHIYQITLPGTRHWYKLGLWYTLQIGGAGEAEYIDSTVRLGGKSVEKSPGTLGSTILTFYEVEENWKFDSSEVARYIASGVPLRGLTGGNVITVASQYYGDLADIYCDGTADQEQIQAAIDYLVSTYGGGTVHLTRGQFNTTAAIELDSNIVLEGEGAETVIEKNTTGQAFYDNNAINSINTDGNEKSKMIIRDIAIERNDSTQYPLIQFMYCNDVVVQSCFLTSGYAGIYMNHCYNSNIINNTIVNTSVTEINTLSSKYINIAKNNIYTTSDYSLSTPSTKNCIDCDYSNVFDNIIHDISILNSNQAVAIRVESNCVIYNNKMYNIFNKLTGDIYCIYISRDENKIVGNTLQDISIFQPPSIAAIYNLGDKNFIQNNNCRDNGSLIYYGACESTAPPQIDGNTATDTSAARSSDEAYEGTYSYKITKTNAAGTAASYWFVDNNTTTDMHGTVIKQGSYRLGLWCYVPSTGGPAAAEVNICISEYDGGWNDETDAMVNQDEWTYLEATVSLDADSTGFRCGVEFASTAAVNEFIYIDNVRLTPMGVANEHDNNFYDGGTDTIIG